MRTNRPRQPKVGQWLAVLASLLGAIALALIAVGSPVGAATSLPTGQAIGAAPSPGATGLYPGGSYFAPTVDAGATYSSSIVLANSNPNNVNVYLYGVDGLTSPGSGAAFTNRGQPLTGAGQWVHFAETTQLLRANTRTTVPFTVDVPAGATPGDHLAGVAIEDASPSISTQRGAVKVNIVTRSVIGVLVRVPGAAIFNAAVGVPTLTFGTYHIGQVTTPITDTGGLIGQPNISVTLNGPLGYVKTVTRTLDTILPGDKTTYSIFWPDSLLGHYTIKSCVSGSHMPQPVCNTGAGSLSVATPTQKKNNGAFTAKPGATSSSSSSSSIPVWAIALIAGLGGVVLIGGGSLLGWRRTKRRLIAQLAQVQGGAPGPVTGVSASPTSVAEAPFESEASVDTSNVASVPLDLPIATTALPVSVLPAIDALSFPKAPKGDKGAKGGKSKKKKPKKKSKNGTSANGTSES